MFVTRLLSGMVLMILSLFFVIVGGIPLKCITMLLAVGAFYEMTKALGIQKEKKFNALTIWGYIAIVVFYALLIFLPDTKFPVLWVVFSIIIFLTIYVVAFPKFECEAITGSIFALVYAPMLLCFLPLTRDLEDGKYIVWMIYISSWGYDTFAYCVGMIFGKTVGNHKMFPVLSPKKSVEGTVGGVIGAALLAWLYGHFYMARHTDIPHIEIALIVIAVFGAVLAQLGDLAASAVKRNKEIKDYSHLIPGHGGILDRFDSMVFTAPAIYIGTLIFYSIIG